MGLIKSKGSHTRIKKGKYAGVEGTLVDSAGRKRKVLTADGQKIKVKKKNLNRNLGR